MPRMVSILAPSAASCLDTALKARAVMGAPSTTTACVDIGWRPICAPTSTSTVMPTVLIASSTSSCNDSGSFGQVTSTPRVSLPRMTTCSTSSRLTSCRDMAVRSTEVTPGRSGPVTVTRTVVSATAVRSWSFGSSHECAPAGDQRVHTLIGSALGERGCFRLGGVLTRAPADVRLGTHPLDHVRVVQLEGGTLGPDARQLVEVVPRRRAGGGPLQRVAVAPRIVHGHDLAVPVALEDVPDEREHRGAQHERADRGDRVQRGEAVGGQVVGVATRHALGAEPVLHQE